jgi:HD-GYP domain-containing protein (c-di-GMP phosphodiesterase class II)
MGVSKQFGLEYFKLRPRRKAGRASLRLSEGLFPLINEKIALIDADGGFYYANPSLCALLDIPYADERVGQRLDTYLSSNFGVEFQALVDLMSISKQPAGPFEVELIAKTGKHIPCQMKLAPFELDGRLLTHLVFEDITVLKESQFELLTAQFEVENSYSSIIVGWAKTLELRNLETRGHSERVSENMVRLALQMGFRLPDTIRFRHGALLHDIGKVGIPDSILLKEGPLSAEEWRIMKRHPVYAYDLLKQIRYLQPALAIPYGHHEKWDGSGYPCGLSQQQIPIEARMFSVVDVWDALTNPRPYRPAWPFVQALEYIRRGANHHFDPEVVKAFVSFV